jgi:DNA-binding winged helix-turn-helix (wHTH) protein
VRSYEFGGFRLDSLRRQLRDAEGKPLDLPARSIDALIVLLERRGEDVSKEQLMKALWPRFAPRERRASA